MGKTAIRARREATKHSCPVGGCPSWVPADKLMCAPHWRLVPRDIQRRVYAAYRSEPGGVEHRGAMMAAITAVTKATA